MHFLGSIGIDIKLLIAQIINFGLLVWLLSRFIYRPVIRRIERDEAALAEAREERGALERDRSAFEKQQQQELKDARTRYQTMLEEAEQVGTEIKQRAKDSAEREEKEIIQQAQRRVESLDAVARKQIVAGEAKKAGDRIAMAFKKRVPQDVMDAALFTVLLDEVGRLSHDMITADEPHALLEYAAVWQPEQKKELALALAKKFKVPVAVTEKRNRKLIGGFRLGFEGVIIESNIADIIDHATEEK